MRVIIFGASGQVGRILVEKFVQQGDDVIAAVRDPKKQALVADSRVTYVEGNAEANINELTDIIRGADLTIFTAGSGGKRLLELDLDGAIRTMKASEAAGVTRYILLSSAGSEIPEKWSQNLYAYNIAKYYADQWLKLNTSLDYAIVRPVHLVNEAGSKRISIGALNDSISREDVASFIASLAHVNLGGKDIRISSGDTNINEAIGKLS